MAADAYEIQQRRTKDRAKSGNEPGRPKEDDVVLTSDVLGEALEEVKSCVANRDVYALAVVFLESAFPC